MSKSTLRRLAVQIPESEQPAFLAATFSLSVLKDAVAIAGGGLTQLAADGAGTLPESGEYFVEYIESNVVRLTPRH